MMYGVTFAALLAVIRRPSEMSLIALNNVRMRGSANRWMRWNIRLLNRLSMSCGPEFLADLARQTVSFYYQQDRVLEAIGVEARAPYPQGFEVVSGDLSLLDPVRRRGTIYRKL